MQFVYNTIIITLLTPRHNCQNMR